MDPAFLFAAIFLAFLGWGLATGRMPAPRTDPKLFYHRSRQPRLYWTLGALHLGIAVFFIYEGFADHIQYAVAK